MSELVCLNCGKEMEYDWAPCSHCGWKPPEPWEEPEEEDSAPQKMLLAKPRPWIQWTAWLLLGSALLALLRWFFRA